MSDHEASSKGYIKIMNYELTIARLDYNDPVFELSTSNIKLEKKLLLRMCLAVTMEASLLKVKFGIYAILTTALPQLSIIPSGIWLILEIFYFIMTIYGTLRYRYAKNCFITISRINTSLMLLILSLVSFYLAIDQRDLKGELPVVSEMVQVLGIFAIVISIIVEMVILLPNIVVKLWLTIKGMISKKSKVKADGVKKNLLIYDWVLESVYNEQKR